MNDTWKVFIWIAILLLIIKIAKQAGDAKLSIPQGATP